MMTRATFLWTLCTVGLLLAVVEFHGAECQIQNISALTGPEQGLVLATFTSGGSPGILCYLSKLNVGEAVCSALLGRSKVFRAVMSNFTGNTTRSIAAVLNGCPDYKAHSDSASNLNFDCDVRTEPDLLKACRNAGGLRSIQCHNVELRHGSTRKEGLVMIATNNGNLSTVCANGIGFHEAAAVCRSVGSANPGLAMPLVGKYRPVLTNTEENVTLIENFKCPPGAFVGNCTFDTPVKITEDCLLPRNRFGVMCPTVVPTPRPMPSPTLKCYRQSAHICFANESLSHPWDVELTGPCNATTESDTGQVCLVIYNYIQCATLTRNNTVYTEHLLVAKFKGENAIGNNTHVRPPLDFHLYCRVVKETLATEATLRPDRITATTWIDGSHEGGAAIELYRQLNDGILGEPVGGSVQVGTTIFAAVILKKANSVSWLVVNDCWAQDGATRVGLVRDKCPAENVMLMPLNETVIVVRFLAFSITGGSGTVSIFCRTVFCRLGDPSPECSRACRTFRGAGSSSGTSSGGADQPQHHVTKPAILTVFPEGYGKSAGKGSQPMASLLLGAFALLVAGLPSTLDK